jgi:hypothetical protein
MSSAAKSQEFTALQCMYVKLGVHDLVSLSLLLSTTNCHSSTFMFEPWYNVQQHLWITVFWQLLQQLSSFAFLQWFRIQNIWYCERKLDWMLSSRAFKATVYRCVESQYRLSVWLKWRNLLYWMECIVVWTIFNIVLYMASAVKWNRTLRQRVRIKKGYQYVKLFFWALSII